MAFSESWPVAPMLPIWVPWSAGFAQAGSPVISPEVPSGMCLVVTKVTAYISSSTVLVNVFAQDTSPGHLFWEYSYDSGANDSRFAHFDGPYVVGSSGLITLLTTDSENTFMSVSGFLVPTPDYNFT